MRIRSVADETETFMKSKQLPPEPRMPALLQSLGFWSRPTAFLERCRARYGTPFTIRLVGQPPLVMISDPEQIKQIFQAPPDVLHPGEGAKILEPVVGTHSVILLDEGPHLQQRKLLLPAFHGEKMQRLSGLMTELAEREVESWPREQPVALHQPLQNLTLEIILRAVFGLDRGARLNSLRSLLTKLLAFADSPLSLLPPPPPRSMSCSSASSRSAAGKRRRETTSSRCSSVQSTTTAPR
jgi:cytochrome P450